MNKYGYELILPKQKFLLIEKITNLLHVLLWKKLIIKFYTSDIVGIW
jgi:hypothetical protein